MWVFFGCVHVFCVDADQNVVRCACVHRAVMFCGEFAWAVVGWMAEVFFVVVYTFSVLMRIRMRSGVRVHRAVCSVGSGQWW